MAVKVHFGHYELPHTISQVHGSFATIIVGRAFGKLCKALRMTDSCTLQPLFYFPGHPSTALHRMSLRLSFPSPSPPHSFRIQRLLMETVSNLIEFLVGAT